MLVFQNVYYSDSSDTGCPFCSSFTQAMVINIDAPMPLINESSSANCTESAKKSKGKDTKKVYSLSPCDFLDPHRRALPFQSSERRPEVRFLEYANIPGITQDKRLAKFQKLAFNSKKLKAEHLGAFNGKHSFRPCTLVFHLRIPRNLNLLYTGSGAPRASETEYTFGSNLTPEELAGLQDINPSAEVTQDTILAQMEELEQELRNTEFRIHFLFRQRGSILEQRAQANHLLTRQENGLS
jgi:hypothetical protein